MNLPLYLNTPTTPREVEEKMRLLLTDAEVGFLKATPKKGDGHRELFRAACILKRREFSDAETEHVLRGKLWDYYHPLDDRDFDEAICNAAVRIADAQPAAPRWPAPNAKLIASVTQNCAGAEDALRSSSSHPCPGTLSTGSIIDRLFRPTDLLCFGDGKAHCVTDTRDSFRNREDEFEFVVANAMSAREGTTKRGRLYPRTLTNVGPIKHLVVEFDGPSRDEQAALLSHLSHWFPLKMVLFSGGKSLHGWHDIAKGSAKAVERFRRYAVSLGADRNTFTANQLVRNPNATRDNGEHQSVLFLQ